MNDHTTEDGQPAGPLTLGIDIGGSRLKCGVLDRSGMLIAEQARVSTPSPATPDAVLAELIALAEPLGTFHRVSVGFPGVVRGGTVLTAPNLGTEFWRGYPLAQVLSDRLGVPVRVLNDGSVQGLGVVAGRGLECVITLGTGVGFALFSQGRLAPHLELGQHPARRRLTYDEYIGNAALHEIGQHKWNRRVERAIGQIEVLVGYDTLYIGGGNAKYIRFELPATAQVVSNQAGITGGAKLWDPRLDEVFEDRGPAVHTAMQGA